MVYTRSKAYDTPELRRMIMGPNPVKLEEELLLSWTPEQLEYMHDAAYWQDMVSRSKDAEVLSVREMESNEEVWADWLAQDNEYAVGDRKAMEAGGGKYLNFLAIVLGKNNESAGTFPSRRWVYPLIVSLWFKTPVL